jgi:pimeloyl-ACP methyl ester carboxylesterase
MVLWRHVQGAASKVTRVCAYDRAGYGFSDPMADSLDADHVAEDIHRLVATSALAGPIIYVGHSIAGLYAVRLQATHPDDVLGVVLVDPAFVGQFRSMSNEFTPASKARLLRVFAERLAALRQCSALATAGALAKPTDDQFRVCVSASDYPEALDANLRAVLERQNREPKVASALLSEYSNLLPQVTMTTVNDREIGDKAVPFGEKPLLILSHGNAEALLPGTSALDTASSTRAWRAGHAALARTSGRGSVRVVEATGHFIQLDDPAAVVRAIALAVRMVRSDDAAKCRYPVGQTGPTCRRLR